jgi:hypothetical protein
MSTKFQIVIIPIALGLLMAGCASTKNKYLNPDQLIGSLSWEIMDATTKQTLDKGSTSVRVKDVQISNNASSNHAKQGGYFQKSIALNKNFSLSIHEFPETSAYTREGFGLTINDGNPLTFCWEWFNLDNEKHATKLQGAGEIGITMQKVSVGREITKMEFLSDVIFRVSVGSSNQSQDRPKYLITILKGSWVIWPSLIGNTITPND